MENEKYNCQYSNCPHSADVRVSGEIPTPKLGEPPGIYGHYDYCQEHFEEERTKDISLIELERFDRKMTLPEVEIAAERFLNEAAYLLAHDIYLGASQVLNQAIDLYEKHFGRETSQSFPQYHNLLKVRSETEDEISRWSTQ